MISAKVIADSQSVFGDRITTMVVTFPRIILAEFNTHRMFSRNTSSSRAIPASKMIEAVETNPFIPIAWQKQHKGMQGYEYLNPNADEGLIIRDWVDARDNAVEVALSLNKNNVTKQLTNRLLEPFMWTTVICTATEWDNFFNLRCPKYKMPGSEEVFFSKKDLLNHYQEVGGPKSADSDEFWFSINKSTAEIHIQALAEAMWDARNDSIPKFLGKGQWHIPFGDKIDFEGDMFLNPQELKLKVATGMCARVSYTVVGDEDKKRFYEKDIELHDLLRREGHMSPFEHCAKVPETGAWEAGVTHMDKNGNVCSGNFKNWIQYRQLIEK